MVYLFCERISHRRSMNGLLLSLFFVFPISCVTNSTSSQLSPTNKKLATVEFEPSSRDSTEATTTDSHHEKGQRSNYCSVDADCVPATCCHPGSCVSRELAPQCQDAACTLQCVPGTMDCNGGSCVCNKNFCVANLRTNTIVSRDSPVDDYSDADDGEPGGGAVGGSDCNCSAICLCAGRPLPINIVQEANAAALACKTADVVCPPCPICKVP